jgi:hypothetical protein
MIGVMLAISATSWGAAAKISVACAEAAATRAVPPHPHHRQRMETQG